MTAPTAVVLVIGTGLSGADVIGLAGRLREALRLDPQARAHCDVGAVDQPTLETVNALARLQVRARALGAPFDLINASARLLELLELAGLAEVLPSATRPQPPGQSIPSSDIGNPNSGNSASVSRNAVNSAIWPPENSST